MVFHIEMELSYKRLRTEALKIHIKIHKPTSSEILKSQHWKYTKTNKKKYCERRGRDRNGRLVVGGCCASFSLPRTTIGQLSSASSPSASSLPWWSNCSSLIIIFEPQALVWRANMFKRQSSADSPNYHHRQFHHHYSPIPVLFQFE